MPSALFGSPWIGQQDYFKSRADGGSTWDAAMALAPQMQWNNRKYTDNFGLATDPADIVAQWYRHALNRDSDTEGQQYWTQAARSWSNDGLGPEAIRAALAGAFYDSPEFNRNYANKPPSDYTDPQAWDDYRYQARDQVRALNSLPNVLDPNSLTGNNRETIRDFVFPPEMQTGIQEWKDKGGLEANAPAETTQPAGIGSLDNLSEQEIEQLIRMIRDQDANNG